MRTKENKKAIKAILAEKESNYPAEYLIGDNLSIIDYRHRMDNFEDQMIHVLDNVDAIIDREEELLAALVSNPLQITDELIEETLNKINHLSKSTVALSIFKAICPTPESNQFIKARFFPNEEQDILPVTFRGMRAETGKSVRTCWLRTEEAQKNILLQTVSKFPKFVSWLSRNR